MKTDKCLTLLRLHLNRVRHRAGAHARESLNTNRVDCERCQLGDCREFAVVDHLWVPWSLWLVGICGVVDFVALEVETRLDLSGVWLAEWFAKRLHTSVLNIHHTVFFMLFVQLEWVFQPFDSKPDFYLKSCSSKVENSKYEFLFSQDFFCKSFQIFSNAIHFLKVFYCWVSRNVNFLNHKFPSRRIAKVPFLVHHIDFCWIPNEANCFPGGWLFRLSLRPFQKSHFLSFRCFSTWKFCRLELCPSFERQFKQNSTPLI